MAVSGWSIRTVTELLLAIPDHWDDDVRQERRRRENWSTQEGTEGARMAVITKTELVNKPGQRIFIDVESELYQDPTEGEDDSSGDEASTDLNQVAVTVNTYRFFRAFTKVANERSFLKEIKKSKGQLARRGARYRDYRICKRLINPGTYARQDGTTISPTPLELYGGGKGSIAALDAQSQMDTAELMKGKLVLQQQVDAIPLEVRNKNGTVVEFFRCIMSEIDAYNLHQDPVYQRAIANGLPRGWDNPAFTGADGYWEGMLVSVWRGITRGCHQGSPWRPECALVADTAAGATELLVGADDKKKMNFLENFTGLNPSLTGKIEIVTPGGTPETLEYDNTGLTKAEKRYKFHLVSPTQHAHGKGDLITPENHHSVALFHGAEIIARASGKPDETVGDVWDSGMQMKVGIEMVSGEQIMIGTDGNPSGYALWFGKSENPAIR